MSDRTVLRTTQDAFERLHEAADGNQRAPVKGVRREALTDLLLDHSAMAARLEELGVKVHDRDDAPAIPPRVRRRPA